MPVNKGNGLSFRETYARLSNSERRSVCKGRQLEHWKKHSRYCPACGTPTEQGEMPILRRCPACGYEIYPVITPAVLVLVRRGKEVLLVQTHAHQATGRMGTVAGFLEIGETLEECAMREVYEETSLRIHNLQYYASQPWPFPSNLMVGFTADYLSGELQIDTEELVHAAFYPPESLTDLLLPLPGSLAYQMLKSRVEEVLGA